MRSESEASIQSNSICICIRIITERYLAVTTNNFDLFYYHIMVALMSSRVEQVLVGRVEDTNFVITTFTDTQPDASSSTSLFISPEQFLIAVLVHISFVVRRRYITCTLMQKEHITIHH